MDMASLRHTKRDWELADRVILVSNESRKSNNSDSVICILKNKGVRNTNYDYVYRPDILDYDLNNGHWPNEESISNSVWSINFYW
jgi:hypothetical protein